MKIKDALPGAGGVVAYYADVCRFLGSEPKAAILLCQFIYWKGKRCNDTRRWIYKTCLELEEETGLGKEEQMTARRILRDGGYLLEEKRGIPRRIYYKLNFEKLQEDWMLWRRGLSRRESPQQGTEKTYSSTPTSTSANSESTKDYTKNRIISSMKKGVAQKMRVTSYEGRQVRKVDLAYDPVPSTKSHDSDRVIVPVGGADSVLFVDNKHVG